VPSGTWPGIRKVGSAWCQIRTSSQLGAITAIFLPLESSNGPVQRERTVGTRIRTSLTFGNAYRSSGRAWGGWTRDSTNVSHRCTAVIHLVHAKPET